MHMISNPGQVSYFLILAFMKASKSGSAFDVDVPGYALRFPRLQKFRDDRKPEDVTSLKEIENMFVAQRPTKEKKSEG